jgi:hypothetical protein
MTKPRFVLSLVVTMAVATSANVLAEDAKRPLTHLSGTFNDYVWVEASAGAGAWHVTGQWTARVKRNTGQAEFTASLQGVRSDLWVLQTSADPANPALRTPHTHHVGLVEANVTVIPNGVRLEGIATITANGSVAPYSGSMVRIEITGGNLLRYSNIKLIFLGAAVDHFGPQPYDGLVVIGR